MAAKRIPLYFNIGVTAVSASYLHIKQIPCSNVRRKQYNPTVFIHKGCDYDEMAALYWYQTVPENCQSYMLGLM